MRVLGIAAVFAFAPLAALAQSATTTCYQDVTGRTVCKSQPQPDKMEACRGGMGALLTGNCTPAEVKAANERASLRKRVGILLADGKCDEAVNEALRAGEIELAKDTKPFCDAR